MSDCEFENTGSNPVIRHTSSMPRRMTTPFPGAAIPITYGDGEKGDRRTRFHHPFLSVIVINGNMVVVGIRLRIIRVQARV